MGLINRIFTSHIQTESSYRSWLSQHIDQIPRQWRSEDRREDVDSYRYPPLQVIKNPRSPRVTIRSGLHFNDRQFLSTIGPNRSCSYRQFQTIEENDTLTQPSYCRSEMAQHWRLCNRHLSLDWHLGLEINAAPARADEHNDQSRQEKNWRKQHHGAYSHTTVNVCHGQLL